MGFVKNLLVGGKAIIGSMVAGIVSWLLMLLVAFIVGSGVGEMMTSRPALAVVLVLSLIVVNIFILGWMYNKLWGWD